MGKTINTIIIGAGASGLFCGYNLAKNGDKPLILDHSDKIGKKILISGGGRCNFTNIDVGHENYRCSNPHFVKSALAKFNPYDFIDLVEQAAIPYYEKKMGQQFCKKSSKDILHMLLELALGEGATIQARSKITNVSYDKETKQFEVVVNSKKIKCYKLIIATGGISFPKLGATEFGYKVAKQFGHKIIPYSPALVGLQSKQFPAVLSGTSLPVSIQVENHRYIDDLLFTYKGISGPAVLSASLYYTKDKPLKINFLPLYDIKKELSQIKQSFPKVSISDIQEINLPKKLLYFFLEDSGVTFKQNISEWSNSTIDKLASAINDFHFYAHGTDGPDKAEVTRGGIDVNEISSKTMESLKQPGLFFIGEVLDVTGELGGFNFHWAWASAFAASKKL